MESMRLPPTSRCECPHALRRVPGGIVEGYLQSCRIIDHLRRDPRPGLAQVSRYGFIDGFDAARGEGVGAAPHVHAIKEFQVFMSSCSNHSQLKNRSWIEFNSPLAGPPAPRPPGPAGARDRYAIAARYVSVKSV